MKSKKIIASVLSVAMVVGMVPSFVGATEVEGGEEQEQEQTVQEEPADDPADVEEAEPEEEADSEADVYGSTTVQASYTEADGTPKTHEATVLDGSETVLGSGWYIADSDLIYNEKITLNGDVTIIIADGVSVSITDTDTDENTLACIYGREHDLTIYGQSNNSGVLTLNGRFTAVDVKDFEMNGGTINVTNITEKGTDGIESRGALTIRGGNLNVSVTGGEGWSTNGLSALEAVDIYGGTISITSTNEGIHLNGLSSLTTFHGGKTDIKAPYTFGGDVLLDFDDEESSLTATPFTKIGPYTVSVGEGKMIGGKTGTLSDDDCKELSGKELHVDGYCIEYFDENGVKQSAFPVILTGDETELAPGFYMINEDVTFDHGIKLRDNKEHTDGTVSIILQGGYTLNIGTPDNRIQGKGLYIVQEETATSNLRIYSACKSTGAMNVYTEGANAPAFDGKGFGMYGGSVTLDSTAIAFVGRSAGDDPQFNMSKGTLAIKGGDAMFCSVSEYDINVNIRDDESSLTCTSTGDLSDYSIFTNGAVNISGGTVNLSGGKCSAKGGISVDWSDDANTVFTLTHGSSIGSQIVFLKAFMTEDRSEFFSGKCEMTDISGKTLIPAKTDVKYIDINGREQVAEGATVIIGNEEELSDGTYVVFGDIQTDNRFVINGDVDLILADGASLTIGKEDNLSSAQGFKILDENTLRIFGQEEGTGSLNIFTYISIPVYSNYGCLIIAGGKFNTTNNGRCVNVQDFKYYGGQVNIPNGELEFDSVTMSWNKPSDSIEVKNYVPRSTGTVSLDKKFSCGDEVFEGEIADASVINGKKLVPYGAVKNVPYVDENGETQYIDAFVIKAGQELSGGWYVVGGPYGTTSLGTLPINGDVKIILADGKTLSVSGQTGRLINCNNRNVTFYGQTEGTGVLNVTVYHAGAQALMGNASSVTFVGGKAFFECTEGGGTALNADDITVKGGKISCINCGIEANNTLTQEGGLLSVMNGGAGLRVTGEAIFTGGVLNVDNSYSFIDDLTVSWTSEDDKYNFGDLVIGEDGSIFFDKAFKTDSIDLIVGSYSDGAQFSNCDLIPLKDPVVGPELEGYAATVTDDIGIKFYFRIPETMRDAEATKVVFTLDDEDPVEVPFDSSNKETIEGEEYYFFRFNVYATKLTAPIKAEFICKGATLITKEDFTVRDYLEAAYKRTSDLKLLFLIKYGACLQQYFAYRQDDPADKGMEDYVDPATMGMYFNGNTDFIDNTVNEIKQTALEPTVDSRLTAVEYYGASLVMKEKLYMKYYFKITDPSSFDIADYKAYSRNVADNPGANEYETGCDTTGKFLYVKVPVNMGDCTYADYDVYLFEGDPAERNLAVIDNYNPVTYMKKTVDGDETFMNAMVYLYAFGKEN